MLALAYLIERLVVAGELESYAAAARILGVTRARMTQVMNLLNLPVGLQEEILLGKAVTERQLRAVLRGLGVRARPTGRPIAGR